MSVLSTMHFDDDRGMIRIGVELRERWPDETAGAIKNARMQDKACSEGEDNAA